MARRRWRALAGVAVTLAALFLISREPANTSQARTDAAPCAVTPRWALQAGQLPDFTPFVSFAHAQLPGSHGLAAHPLWIYTQFECGEYYGFLADMILGGRYRQQDDALARSLHYNLGKWPLVPFVGNVITERPHATLEIYEGIYQFRSAQAASQWLQGHRWTPAPPHGVPAAGLPGGFIARTGVAGPDDGQHEREIGVNGRIGSTVMLVSFEGGRHLSWADVRPFWARAWSQLPNTIRSTADTTSSQP